MASSRSNEVVVRNPFDTDGYGTDNSDQSTAFASEQVVASPEESKEESDEPKAKKQKKMTKKEHYTIVLKKEKADINKIVDKIVKMKERNAQDEEIYRFVAGYLAPKSRNELSCLLKGLAGPINVYDDAANSKESRAVVDLIALGSSDAKRNEYFHQINEATRGNLSVELDSQNKDVDKYKAKFDKATANVRILSNKIYLASAEERGNIAQDLFAFVLQAKKGKTNVLA
jgi:leucyl aminopeptidase